jgi:hypothetical protein
MPILLWYLPFTMLYGACDLLFAELEMQVNQPADLDEADPQRVEVGRLSEWHALRARACHFDLLRKRL